MWADYSVDVGDMVRGRSLSPANGFLVAQLQARPLLPERGSLVNRRNAYRQNPVPARVGNLLSHQRSLPQDPSGEAGAGCGARGGSDMFLDFHNDLGLGIGLQLHEVAGGTRKTRYAAQLRLGIFP